MNSLTIAMPYYEAPQMLIEQLRWWEDYATEKMPVSIVIVDDGSPKNPAQHTLIMEKIPPGLSLEVYRVKENIPWNHAGARNLAMHVVKTKWILLTDIDHLLLPWSVKKLLQQQLDPSMVYQPPRYDRVDGIPMRFKRHIDSYIITKDLFWEVGGYDETLAGYWNGAFEPFRKALKREVEIREIESGHLLRFNNDDKIPDANVVEWGRKGSEYDINQNPEMKKYQKRAMSVYKPKVLQFEWEQVI